MKKKHGWIIEAKPGHPCGSGFYHNTATAEYLVNRIQDARVYDTRSLAREVTHTDEVVRKVSLSKRRVPINIVLGR